MTLWVVKWGCFLYVFESIDCISIFFTTILKKIEIYHEITRFETFGRVFKKNENNDILIFIETVSQVRHVD